MGLALESSSGQAGRVAVRVQTTWRTRALLLFAFLAAGAIAYYRVRDRMQRTSATAEPAAHTSVAAPEPRDDGLIEVEIVGD